jgi:hypothetical protein
MQKSRIRDTVEKSWKSTLALMSCQPTETIEAYFKNFSKHTGLKNYKNYVLKFFFTCLF